MSLKIAARQSDLARIQALHFERVFSKAHPSVETHCHFRESLGDKNLNDPLWKMPEQGVFTQDFYADLVSGKHDAVVHSWKDLPTEERPETEIYATLEREDMRDLLLVKKAHRAVIGESKRLRVYSSSPRRAYNLTPFLKWAIPGRVDEILFESVRGNMQTRIEKLLGDENIDALIVAKAAIDRLISYKDSQFSQMQDLLKEQLEELDWMVLPLSSNPCAAAQGALAVEIRRDRDDVKKQLGEINNTEVFKSVRRERETLASFGGGCHQKIGVSVLQREYGEVFVLRGLTDAGEVLEKRELSRTKPLDWPQVEKEQVFPAELGEATFFRRESLAVDEGHWASQLVGKALWIARANALPEDYSPNEQLVWCSGLKTWEKLAARGVWVNGCAEGLGEKEDERLDALAGDVSWTKLTHETGLGENRLATYKLVENSSLPDMSGKTHFYWMSYSQFRTAVEKCPEVANGYHACGPGHTHDKVSEYLQGEFPGEELKIGVFLDHASWLKEVMK